MKINEVVEPGTMTLWHGGRNLQFNHMEMLPAKKGRWEYGPGLYLTTHYETARKYAKGGGTVYKVIVERGTELNTVDVPMDDAIGFVKRYVIGKHRNEIIEDLQNNLNRLGALKLSVLINLCINYDALSSKNTVELRKFIVAHGADYEISKGFGGRSETIVIVFNPTVIKKVTPVKASEVSTSEFEQTITEVKIDNRNGAGNTPNNEDVDYKGFRVLMKPSVFLSLVPYFSRISDKVDRMRNYVKSGGAIASPFLKVEIPEEWINGDFTKTAEVVGHEGRHRMLAVWQTEGDTPIETHLFISQYNANRVKPEWLEKINSRLMSESLYSESGNLVLGPFFQLMK
jgi:hypothetical protein